MESKELCLSPNFTQSILASCFGWVIYQCPCFWGRDSSTQIFDWGLSVGVVVSPNPHIVQGTVTSCLPSLILIFMALISVFTGSTESFFSLPFCCAISKLCICITWPFLTGTKCESIINYSGLLENCPKTKLCHLLHLGPVFHSTPHHFLGTSADILEKLGQISADLFLPGLYCPNQCPRIVH